MRDKLSKSAIPGRTILCILFLVLLVFENAPLDQERIKTSDSYPQSQGNLQIPSASQYESLIYNESGYTTSGSGDSYKKTARDIQLYEQRVEAIANYRMEYNFSITESTLMENYTMMTFGFMGTIGSEIYFCIIKLDQSCISTLNIVGNQISGQFNVSLPQALGTVFYIETFNEELGGSGSIVKIRSLRSPQITVKNLEEIEDKVHIYLNGWNIKSPYTMNQINDDLEQYHFSINNSLQKMAPWENGEYSGLSQVGFRVGVYNESGGASLEVYPFTLGFSDQESISESVNFPSDERYVDHSPITNVEYLTLSLIFSDDENYHLFQWKIYQMSIISRYTEGILIIGLIALVGLCALKYKPLKRLSHY